ncbi:hepatoma-derived growth factor-related protein 2 [Dioscorea cayenensis subsp. rotundata]|uniref:Hepatoma-derived growth factor-related protein 2 n=1 Tax=Dioscorea cayennensis subsp. rotundata TaxID=55577 RepID=A0AB40CPW8_DIOCR|nr:hepatoma-derived growth factor-related protein 2 [Dioscorea cayenensis subsp. rotundata]
MGRREWYHKGSSTGCMSGMLNFFDFHQLLFTTTNVSSKNIPSISLDSLPEVRSGLEAPRNSLEELNDEEQEEEYFDVPVGVRINQEPKAVVTRREKMEFYLEEERKSSSSSSQAATPRTPSLVARLMGLDLLPERSSSCSYSSPATPVASVITKRMKKKKDFDNVHESNSRKPLRNLNCNTNGSRSLPDSPRASSVRKSCDVEPRLSLQLNKENVLDCKTSSKSGNYATEIVKQVKESILSNRRDATLGIASDENGGIKSRRTRTCERSNKSSKSISTTSSIFSNHNIKFQKPVKPTRSPPPPPPPPPPRLDIKKPNIKPKKYEKKAGYERFTKNVKKKSKTKETQKATQTKVNQDFELKYIRSVLEHADLLSAGSHSNFNPIDPVLFHLLELKLPPLDQHCTGPFKNRWNRKLLFHLVVEIIGELAQHQSFATKTTESLFNHIAKQINSYPGANCQVLDDIDALIEGDLPERNVRRLLKHPAVEMEVVEIMEEIEGDIVEELIGEMVMMT